MTSVKKYNWKTDWEEFKKELTPNNVKIFISFGIPFVLGLSLYSLWIKLINPLLMDRSIYTTQYESLTSLCIVIAFIAPLFPLTLWFMSIGLWIGKITRFYNENHTRRMYFDDVEYFIRDMPQDQRDKIKEILSSYKSKVQLRKERMKDKSWFRRNFT